MGSAIHEAEGEAGRNRKCGPRSFQFSSAAQSHLTLCDPMDHSPPGFPVLYHLSELAQTLSIECVMRSNYLILCHPLLLLPSIFPSIRIFSNKSVLQLKWPKHWSFRFSISPSNEYWMNIEDWFPLRWTGWLSLQCKGLSRVFSNTKVPKHQFFGAQLSL